MHEWTTTGAIRNGDRFVLYTDFIGLNNRAVLPANNQTAETSGELTTFPIWFDMLADGKVDLLGEFSVSSQAAPSVAGYNLVSDSVLYSGLAYLAGSSPNFVRGVFGNWRSSNTTSHGEAKIFDYSIFNDGSGNFEDLVSVSRSSQSMASLVSATLEFELAPGGVIPEPSGFVFIGLSGMILTLVRRRG